MEKFKNARGGFWKEKSKMPTECCKFGFHIDLEVIKTFEIIVKTGLKYSKQTCCYKEISRCDSEGT